MATETEAVAESTPAGHDPHDDAPPVQRASSAWAHWSLLLMSIVVLGLSVVLSVRGETEVLVPVLGAPLPGVCTFQRLTGVDCPGCGLTRCFISVAHGDVSRAWSFNPAGILMFAIVVWQIPYRSLQLWRLKRRQPEWRMTTLGFWTVMLLAAALFVQWIVKILVEILWQS